jgi:hypothetical protein
MICDLCGNESTKTFEIRAARKRYIFDSFQCAIQFLAPSCPHCGCKIAGHGVEVGGLVYCSVHCSANVSAAPSGEKASPAVIPRPRCAPSGAIHNSM